MLVKESESINGIDYLEVKRVEAEAEDDNGNTLTDLTQGNKSSILLLVFLFKEPSEDIEIENLIIEGGSRVQNLKIVLAGKPDVIFEDLNEIEKEIIKNIEAFKRKFLFIIKPELEGDFSIYTLKFIEKDNPDEILVGFDPILSKIDFSFKIECPTDFDCKLENVCSPTTFGEPVLDYMTKDYSSFNKLISSRFAQIIPDWREKSPADLVNVLVELLSYVGDHLSYYQDSVSTEAYLGTARKRISIKRHARLLDYYIDEGSNARTWICFEVEASSKNSTTILPKSTKVLTGKAENLQNPFSISLSEDQFKEIIASDHDVQVFETMYDIALYSARNEMKFYSWAGTYCCLPKGATHATLLNEGPDSLDIYLFSWQKILEDANQKKTLKEFLKRLFPRLSSWISQAELEINADNTLKIYDNNAASNFVSIKLINGEREKAYVYDNHGNAIYELLTKDENGETRIFGLCLNAGDVIIFEEKISPTTLNESDKNKSYRQAVKLRKVKRSFDPINITGSDIPSNNFNGTRLLEIYWDKEDALCFPLCINVTKKEAKNNITDSDSNNNKNEIISIARGNVVLADHGYTILEKREDLGSVQSPTSSSSTRMFYPKLSNKRVTFAAPLDEYASAYSLVNYDKFGETTRYPQIYLQESIPEEIKDNNDDDNGDSDNDKDQVIDYSTCYQKGSIGGSDYWCPQRDLLSSDRFSREFVLEIDNEGTTYVRFGDDKNGKKPKPRIATTSEVDQYYHFYATYRIGNGKVGNVGADTIKRIVLDDPSIQGIRNLSNPISASGGKESETIEKVRHDAPVAFMRQERAVTEDDYVDVLKRHPQVQRATALFRWTGSWYTVYVTIDRLDGKEVDESFKTEIYNFLNKFRLAGYDLEITSPKLVPLDIKINVCVKPNHYSERIKKTLVNVFSNRCNEDGTLGFFHPDNFTFGQSLYLSQIYKFIMNVEGVQSALVKTFKRMDKTPNNELEQGFVRVHHHEIISVDSDPNFPENGIINFEMEGGI